METWDSQDRTASGDDSGASLLGGLVSATLVRFAPG